jgi:hypothetical protein
MLRSASPGGLNSDPSGNRREVTNAFSLRNSATVAEQIQIRKVHVSMRLGQDKLLLMACAVSDRPSPAIGDQRPKMPKQLALAYPRRGSNPRA